MPQARLQVFLNPGRVREVHQCILTCLNHGFGASDDIVAILGLIDVARISRALAELIDYGIVETTTSGMLQYSEAFKKLCAGFEEASAALDLEVPAGSSRIEDPEVIRKILLAVGVEQPDALARALWVELASE